MSGRVSGVAGACAALVALAACPGPARHPEPPRAAEGTDDVRHVRGLPPIAVIARDGDPRGGVAAAVATSGIAPERGAEVAVALAALVELRLQATGLDATVTPGWDGYRARTLADAESAPRIAEAMRAALLAPLADAELAPVRRKLAALAVRPMKDAALLDAVRCTGEAFATPVPAEARPYTQTPAPKAPSAADVEGWRRAAHGVGRVALAITGSAALGDEVTRALERAGAWPVVSAPPPETLPPLDEPAKIYDATGDISAGQARATFAVHVPSAAQALLAAEAVGRPRGPLPSRLGALDAPAKVRSVVAAAHPRGGCLAVTVDVGDGVAALTPARIATAVALARQELSVEVSETVASTARGAQGRARRASDPRESADRAAWWALVEDPPAAPGGDASGLRMSVAVGVAGGRDTPPSAVEETGAEALRSALDRATVAWHEPVVEARVAVERGQGELWILVGSPCGTLSEAESDAGLGAAVAIAAARAQECDLSVEPWIAPDGIGLVAHGPPLPGEGAAAHARRITDAAARAFAADPIADAQASAARRQLLRTLDQDEARALGALASAISPGHPSWIVPFGAESALGRVSDLSVELRASALRAGPLRVAVLANTDAAQAEAAVRAADRWVARRPGEARACPAPAVPGAPRPGTYPVDAATGSSETLLGLALPAAPEEPARVAASWLATALDGDGGLLARALGAGLARSWSARVVGGTRAAALVISVVTAPGAMDAAVAQVRALLDRLRQGAYAESDHARATSVRARAALAAQMDPRARLVNLWQSGGRGAQPASEPAPGATAPTLDALRAQHALMLHDDALVIVALRPRPAGAGAARGGP